MAGTVVLSVLVTGLTTRLYLTALGVRISIGEAFWLAAVMFLCSYLPLQLNLLLRAKYLKQLHSLPYVAYTAMVMTNFGVMFCAIGIYGVLSLTIVWWHEARINVVLAAVFILCAVLPPVAGVMILRLGPGRWGGWRITGDIVTAAGTICQRRSTLAQAIGLTVVALFIWSVRFHAAALHVTPGNRLELAMILPPVAALSTYLAITPSGLGVRELMSSGLTEMIGMDHTVGLAVTTVERAVSVVCFALLGLLAVVLLGRRFRGQSQVPPARQHGQPREGEISRTGR
jgi:uncharacterized membrane protein YbhN (UPF0104 family)